MHAKCCCSGHVCRVCPLGLRFEGRDCCRMTLCWAVPIGHACQVRCYFNGTTSAPEAAFLEFSLLECTDCRICTRREHLWYGYSICFIYWNLDFNILMPVGASYCAGYCSREHVCQVWRSSPNVKCPRKAPFSRSCILECFDCKIWSKREGRQDLDCFE